MKKLALLALALSACTTLVLKPEHFHKPRMTVEQRQKDFNNCLYGAYGIPEGATDYDQKKYVNRGATRCMVSRGYLRRDCTDCPPSKYLTDATVTDRERSRKEFERAVAEFDACIGRAATKEMRAVPDVDALVASALDLCRGERVAVENALMDSNLTVRYGWRRYFPKANAPLSVDGFAEERARRIVRERVGTAAN